jgi:hypothetical protein
MDIIQQAITLNNDAVQALVDGDDARAVESLTRAIKIFKEELSKPPPVSLPEDSSFFVADKSSSSSTTFTVQLPELHQEQQSFIFNQALKLPEQSVNGETGPAASDSDLHIYTATVIFNFALAHHRKGMSSGQDALLLKSEKLYSMVLKVLSDDDHNTSRIAILVKLASVNNLAQRCFESGNFEQARQGLGHLSSTFRTKSLSFLQEENIKELLLNVLLLKPPKVAPAA